MRLAWCHRCVLLGILAATALPAAPLRVLFLGNSLTGVNDVPALVQAMARLQGVDLQYTALAPGGYALEDHWRDGQQRHLETGNYHVLVMQQGPSTLADSQANLREWTVAWAAQARRFGTRPALYMVWPVRGQANGFALVAQSYRNAAIAADAALFPAGEAWQQALRANPAPTLYQSDDLHATGAGSFLAAMVIARGLVGLDPARVPTTVHDITISETTLTVFRAAVQAIPAAALDSEGIPIFPTTEPVAVNVSPGAITATAGPASVSVSPGSVTATAGPASVSVKGGGVPSPAFLVILTFLGLVRRRQALHKQRARPGNCAGAA